MNSHIRRPSGAENRANSQNVWRIWCTAFEARWCPRAQCVLLRQLQRIACASQCSECRKSRLAKPYPMAESAFSLLTKEKAPPTRGKVAKEETRVFYRSELVFLILILTGDSRSARHRSSADLPGTGSPKNAAVRVCCARNSYWRSRSSKAEGLGIVFCEMATAKAMSDEGANASVSTKSPSFRSFDMVISPRGSPWPHP